MSVPRQLLRLVFAFSAFACALILLLFLRGRAPATAAFWGGSLAGALALTAAVCALAFRRGGLLLAPGLAWGPVLTGLLGQLLLAYTLLALGLSALGLGLLALISDRPREAVALALLAGLWLALWIAPGVAAWRCARRLGRADSEQAL